MKNLIVTLGALGRPEPALVRTGWVMGWVLALSLFAIVMDGRQMGGLSVWVKPAKFAASVMVWCWTMAWCFGALAPEAVGQRAARIIIWGTIISGSYEVGWISLRSAFALPSHFATDFIGNIGYGVMGLGAVTLCALAAWLGVLVLSSGKLELPSAMRQAIGLGLVISGVTGAMTGATISVLASPYVGGAGTPGPWPPFFWAAHGGDLRVAHFIGIHAMQALPLLAMILAAIPRLKAAPLVQLGAVLWLAFTGFAFAQALRGIALF
jgi:hypothetical protein